MRIWKKGILVHFWWKGKLVQLLWKAVWRFLIPLFMYDHWQFSSLASTFPFCPITVQVVRNPTFRNLQPKLGKFSPVPLPGRYKSPMFRLIQANLDLMVHILLSPEFPCMNNKSSLKCPCYVECHHPQKRGHPTSLAGARETIKHSKRESIWGDKKRKQEAQGDRPYFSVFNVSWDIGRLRNMLSEAVSLKERRGWEASMVNRTFSTVTWS